MKREAFFRALIEPEGNLVALRPLRPQSSLQTEHDAQFLELMGWRRSAKSKEYAQPPDRIPPADTKCEVQQLVEVMVEVTFSLPSQSRRGETLSFTTVRFLRRLLCVVRKRPFFGRIGPPPEEVSHAPIFGPVPKMFSVWNLDARSVHVVPGEVESATTVDDISTSKSILCPRHKDRERI